MTSIAIIDVIGLAYDGNTLQTRGLGGSESAVIYMAKELSNIGFDVTVFNNCQDSQANPGIYDNVKYIDISTLDLNNNHTYDIVISSRTVIPFLKKDDYPNYTEFNPTRYEKIKTNAKLKIVWMHDTFCRGDELLEDMIVNKDIDELFTLSDFHTSYVTNANHGKRRMFEVLKKSIFMTRNGIKMHKNDVNISKKDPFLYVFNASVTKGMLPLLKNIWPTFKAHIPQARLKVIGGYYRFRENAAPDAQEQQWLELINDRNLANLDVEFTGIITQQEIANILEQASFMMYPSAFPETFGISSLESLAYNTPLITTRFGALEETAIEDACYLIDYAIEPNSLYPNINLDIQCQKFIDLAINASNDRYLHQQKMYKCNIIKDICTWDTVALQWKQHFYRKLGLYLSRHDYNKVSIINNRVKTVFNRKFTNIEDNSVPTKKEQRIVVITPMYNAQNYIAKCIESVTTQNYDNYHMIVIDDNSSDNSYNVALDWATDKVTIISNKQNRGAIFNQLTAIQNYCEHNDIVMLLDGDDSLVNNNEIFNYFNNIYSNNETEFTYGSCWSMVDNIPLIAQHYPLEVKQNKTYRSHKFNWNIPYTHLRTFKAYLLDGIEESKFQNERGEWLKAGGDVAMFYNVIEKADPNKIKAISDIIVNYNDMNPLNDYKVNATEQTKNANHIMNGNSPINTPQKTILIAIPSAKYIEPKTMESIYNQIVPQGYTTTFQYFYGYSPSQIKNLICHWGVHFTYVIILNKDAILPNDFLLMVTESEKIVHDYKFTYLSFPGRVINSIQYPYFTPQQNITSENETFINHIMSTGVARELINH